MTVSDAAIRVLLVIGSTSMRSAARDGLASDPGFEIAGEAKTAEDGRALAWSSKFDVALVDTSLPDGTATGFLESLRKARPGMPVVVITSPTAMPAMSPLASTDVLLAVKPTGAQETLLGYVQRDLLPLIAQAAAGPAAFTGARPPVRLAPAPDSTPSLILIVSSTGGPNALEAVLSGLPAAFPTPIMIVQHMPASFTPLLAARLHRECALTVIEAVDGTRLAPGTVYVAPGDRHLSLSTSSSCRVSDGPPVKGCRPSADVLLGSAADRPTARSTLAVILTGMGSDGTNGAGKLVAAGGSVICQDESSSVVWGMPGSAVRAGHAYVVLPLDRIGPEIESRVRTQQ